MRPIYSLGIIPFSNVIGRSTFNGSFTIPAVHEEAFDDRPLPLNENNRGYYA
jgi:hypothetical protein